MTRRSNLPQGNAALLTGAGLSRRRFLGLTAGGLLVSTFDPLPGVVPVAGAAPSVPLRGTARNCVFVFLQGGPSHVDMWDLKEGPSTPAEFAPTSYGPVRFPQGLLPKTAEQLDRMAIVRSGLAWALVHPLAQAWSQISRNPTAALGAIAPHIGSVVALERNGSAAPGAVLPTFPSLHSSRVKVAPLVGSGFLPARYGAPLSPP